MAELDKRARERLHPLVVERAAVKRMRMRDQRHAASAAFGSIDGAFDAACRAGDELAAGSSPHRYIRRRSTIRPGWGGSSVFSSTAAPWAAVDPSAPG